MAHKYSRQCSETMQFYDGRKSRIVVLDEISNELKLHFTANEEKNYLNNYHHMVFETIAPHLNEEERTWLLKYTRNIKIFL